MDGAEKLVINLWGSFRDCKTDEYSLFSSGLKSSIRAGIDIFSPVLQWTDRVRRSAAVKH